MLDWIFEGIVNWIATIATQVMDAIAGLFLDALGTDLTTMEEYFPFLEKAYEVMQYTAWAILFLITVWQLFRVFGGPISEAESPWILVVRSAMFAVLIGYAKPIFEITLDIARAPYTALMDLEMTGEDFTFAGIEESLKNGILTIAGIASIVGTLLLIILLIALGWNYFKLLLETVERYIVVGVLCYTSPLAYCMGGSKATNPVFKSWCRMVGAQLLLLVMNVWFLRAFNSSVGQFIATGGTLTSGEGSIFLWTFCALAFLKTAQRFDSYLAAMGLNVAQTGSSMGFELLMAARVISGIGSGARSAGSVFRSGSAASAAGTTGGFASGFASKFKGNSYVRDAVVNGGVPMGAGGGIGFVGRTFGGIAARNGATLNTDSISSVASRIPGVSGSIGGDIANRSLSNYMPQLSGYQLTGTQVSGGRISTTATGSNGLETAVEMYSTSQYERPSSPHSIVSAADGSQWYQMAYGQNAGAFYDAPHFTGNISESSQVASAFPSVTEGTTMRTASDGVMEVNTPDGNSMWYSSAYYNEPDAPHETVQAANGVEWYAMQQQAAVPEFESGSEAAVYNQAQFAEFMPGYEEQVTEIDGSGSPDGRIEVRHEDGSGTMFYDSAQFDTPRGEYMTYEDANGHEWYAVDGDAAVVRRPVFEDGEPVYDGDNVRTVTVDTVRYDTAPNRFDEPSMRDNMDFIPPRRK